MIDDCSGLAEDGDDVDDEEAIVSLEVDRDRAARIEQELVVFAQGNVGRMLDLGRDGDHAARDGA